MGKRMVIVTMAVLAAGTIPCLGADANVEEIVAQAVKGAKTNAERAQKLLEASQMVKDDGALSTALLKRGLDFGIKDLSTPAARETAEGLMDQLVAKGTVSLETRTRQADLYRAMWRADRSYEGRDRATRKLVAALLDAARLAEADRKYAQARDAYKEAESVAAQMKLPERAQAQYGMKRADGLIAAALKQKEYLAALKKDPKDLKARMALLKLLVLEFDDPAEAAKWLTDEVDQVWTTCVRLAVRDVAGLEEAGCRDLGNWYYGLLGEASTAGKGTAAGRARACYQRFLKLHKAQDPVALKVRLNLKDLDAQTASTGVKPSEEAGWVDLIPGVKLTEHVHSGAWTRKGEGLGCDDSSKSFLEVPGPTPAPKEYDLQITFARMNGSSPIMFTLPVGDSHVCLFLDSRSSYSYYSSSTHYYGLEYVRNTGSSEVAKVKGKGLANRQAYTLLVRLRAEKNGLMKLAVSLNNEDVLQWTGKESDLSCHSSWSLSTTGAVGVGNYDNQTIFNKIRIKPVK